MLQQATLAALLLVAAWASFGGVRADTPGNCMWEQVQGSWTFFMSADGHDSAVNCTAPFAVAQKYTVTLGYPNTVVDMYGNHGTWTMIYNQGFEVTVRGLKFFAFSMYTTDPSGKVTSQCGLTFHGWFHGLGVANGNWGCYYGIHQSSKEHAAAAVAAPLSVQKASHAAAANPVAAAAAAAAAAAVPTRSDATRRAQPYRHNPAFIERVNAAQKTWIAGEYEHMELKTIGQLERRAGGAASAPLRALAARTLAASGSRFRASTTSPLNLPNVFDWRNVDGINYVSPVRDQDECGSCYSFASMGMMEARIRVMSNNTQQPVLSTQYPVACSNYAQGCDGGFPYLIAGKFGQDFGLIEESCFPYLGKDSACTPCSDPQRHWTLDYYYIGGYYGASTAELMQLEILENGPIAVSFEVYPDFMHYKGGIYVHTGEVDEFNPFELTNHVVVIVGWGEDSAGTPYWTVKNSWSADWGEDGFFRILRNADECAIESLTVGAIPIL